MSEIVLGLDFGSSNVSIVKKDDGLVLKEDNLIAVKRTQNGLENYKVGSSARALLGKTDSSISIFSPKSAGKIINVDSASYLLKSFLEKLNIKPSVFNKLKIISLTPMGLSDDEKQKYIDICTNVGAKEVVLIPKIFCSAIGENINISANSAHLIVDIGGGTVDCAVINMNTIIAGCSLGVGGRSMDSSLVDYIKFKYGATIGLKTAQRLKEEIGSLYTNDYAKVEVMAVEETTNTPIVITITAKDIFDAISVYVDEIVKIIQTTINTLSPEISSDVTRNGIVVCGGFSKMVGLSKYLRQKLDQNIIVSDESNNSTTLGLTKIVNNQQLLDNILENL